MKKTIIIFVILFGLYSSASAQIVEREILVGNVLLKYSFANSAKDIESAILKTTRVNPNIENAAWIVDQEIPTAVKDAMIELNKNYATTPHQINNLDDRSPAIHTFGTACTGTVHRRVGDRWFTNYYRKLPCQ